MSDKIISDFDWGTEGKNRNEKYPWADWTNGQTWSVDPADWDLGAVSTLRMAVFNRARRDGLKVRTTVPTDRPKRLVFQFYKQN